MVIRATRPCLNFLAARTSIGPIAWAIQTLLRHPRVLIPKQKSRPAAPGGIIYAKAVAIRSMRERIGAELEVHRHRLHALAAFLEPRHAVAARGPQAAAFPARIRI